MVVKKEIEPIPVYRLKVTLDGIRPPIWRRIQVREDVTLFKLHKILQAVMDGKTIICINLLWEMSIIPSLRLMTPGPWKTRMRSEPGSSR